MTSPDLNRIGGLEWIQRTNGRLTRRERLHLLASVLNTQRDYLAHRLRRARPYPSARPSDRDIRPPDSRFAREVEAAAALDDAHATALADAITVHTTPGITVERDGALGYYIQSGALVDITGNRVWDLSKPLIDDTLARYDRRGFTRGLGGHFTAEAKAVPGGRFSMLRCCGFVPLMHMAPFDQK